MRNQRALTAPQPTIDRLPKTPFKDQPPFPWQFASIRQPVNGSPTIPRKWWDRPTAPSDRSTERVRSPSSSICSIQRHTIRPCSSTWPRLDAIGRRRRETWMHFSKTHRIGRVRRPMNSSSRNFILRQNEPHYFDSFLLFRLFPKHRPKGVGAERRVQKGLVRRPMTQYIRCRDKLRFIPSYNPHAFSSFPRAKCKCQHGSEAGDSEHGLGLGGGLLYWKPRVQ